MSTISRGSVRYELVHSPDPEFETLSEKQPPTTSTNSLSSWLKNLLFTRSPRATQSKRTSLLSSHSRECRSERSSAELSASTDIESQAASTSTLFESSVGATSQKQQKRSRISARVVSDAIIGLSDGLTVPFALTAGLSALGNTRVVIFAGLAELTAGAISMGLGGYLGAKSEEESYIQTLTETRASVTTGSASAASSIQSIFEPYDLPTTLTDELTLHLSKSPHLVDFLMHFQHNSPEQESSRAITCALTIAAGYFLGGFVPLLPYFFVGEDDVLLALWWSLGVMALSLFAFGYGKTCFVCGWNSGEHICSGIKGGLQMVVVGGLAAGCAMGLVRLFNGFIA